jgi:LysR family transcriptional regulator, nitrogen assimilation regulatory protein
MPNFKALRYFVGVADAGSFTAASLSLSIAQPALTRQVRELEAELSVELFQRLPRGVRLTASGITLYDSAQKILNELSKVKLALSKKQAQGETTLTLGASPTLARVLLPSVFENCRKSVSGINLRAKEAFTPALLDWLELGLVDMAVVTNPDSGRRLAFTPLLGEPFALVSHVSLAIAPVVSIQTLARIPVLITSLHRSLVEHQLATLGGKLKIEAEIDSVDSIREIVMRGKRAAIMPISVFKQPSIAETVTISEISGVQLNRLLVLATRIGSTDNPVVAAMQKLIELEFAKLVKQGVFSFASLTANKRKRNFK